MEESDIELSSQINELGNLFDIQRYNEESDSGFQL